MIKQSDQAPEILAARKRLGFVHEGALDDRFPHNSLLERDIRTVGEVDRATHIGAGFEIIPDLWPLSIEYAATILSTQQIAAGKDRTAIVFL